jgi:hypothetical protein
MINLTNNAVREIDKDFRLYHNSKKELLTEFEDDFYPSSEELDENDMNVIISD